MRFHDTYRVRLCACEIRKNLYKQLKIAIILHKKNLFPIIQSKRDLNMCVSFCLEFVTNG
jgi:hypothetical protein